MWSDADLRADAARADALMARILGTGGSGRLGVVRPCCRDRDHDRDRHRPRHPARPRRPRRPHRRPARPGRPRPRPRRLVRVHPPHRHRPCEGLPARLRRQDLSATRAATVLLRTGPGLPITRLHPASSPATCSSTTRRKHPTAPPRPATAAACAPNATNARPPASSTSPTAEPTAPPPSTPPSDRRSASLHAPTSPHLARCERSPSRSISSRSDRNGGRASSAYQATTTPPSSDDRKIGGTPDPADPAA